MLTFYRAVASVMLAAMIVEIFRKPHSEPMAAVLVTIGIMFAIFASVWFRAVVSHPAYPAIAGALCNLGIFLNAWLRHSRATSLFGALLLALLVFAIPALWFALSRRGQDYP
jgi:hypothetical protein